MIYDLIIIGSGSVGSAAGYYTAKSGLKVLMIDSGTPPHDNGSYHGATRVTRSAYGEGAKYVPMCLRARELWAKFEEDCNQDLVISCGVLNMGPDECSFIKNVKATSEGFELNVENLTSVEIKERYFGINVPESFVGVFEKDAGYIKSELAVGAFIKCSKEAGAEQLFECIVKSVKPIENHVAVVTNKGTFESKKAVVSTGSWINNLFSKIPVTLVRKVFTVNEYPKHCNNMPVTLVMIDDYCFYSMPDEDGMKFGQHNGGQVIETLDDLVPFGSLKEDRTETSEFVDQFFSEAGASVKEIVCSYDMSSDGHFIIDTLPESNNILVITGLSGHGFKFATVLGEVAAQFALGEHYSVDITPFSLNRFN